jgi:hypothetical protein
MGSRAARHRRPGSGPIESECVDDGVDDLCSQVQISPFFAAIGSAVFW